jgi:hypothetical protein
MVFSKKIKRIACKVVEHNLRKDGWDIIRSMPNDPGPSDIHAVKDNELFILHLNPAVHPEIPQEMNSEKMGIAKFFARKMNARLYSADIIFNPDLTIKDLKYRYLER